MQLLISYPVPDVLLVPCSGTCKAATWFSLYAILPLAGVDPVYTPVFLPYKWSLSVRACVRLTAISVADLMGGRSPLLALSTYHRCFHSAGFSACSCEQQPWALHLLTQNCPSPDPSHKLESVHLEDMKRCGVVPKMGAVEAQRKGGTAGSF